MLHIEKFELFPDFTMFGFCARQFFVHLAWQKVGRVDAVVDAKVGGHSPLFCLDPVTVCKPLEQRELNFYSSLPRALLPFTPHFKGSMQVGKDVVVKRL